MPAIQESESDPGAIPLIRTGVSHSFTADSRPALISATTVEKIALGMIAGRNCASNRGDTALGYSTALSATNSNDGDRSPRAAAIEAFEKCHRSDW
jgi:hypothetical protein